MQYKAENGLMFPDNITDTCTDCGATIQLRPVAPMTEKKICFPCATDRGAFDPNDSEITRVISPDQLEELKRLCND